MKCFHFVGWIVLEDVRFVPHARAFVDVSVEVGQSLSIFVIERMHKVRSETSVDCVNDRKVQ